MANYDSKFIEIGGSAAITDGPLSAQIADKLNEIYKVKVDSKTGISMETIVTDIYDNASTWIAAQLQHVQDHDENAIDANAPGYVFAVNSGEVEQSDVVSMIDSVSDMPDDHRKRIIYAEKDIAPTPNYYALKATAEELDIPITSDINVVYEMLGVK